MKKIYFLLFLTAIHSSTVSGDFLNTGKCLAPQKALIYDPCRFNFNSDAINDYVQGILCIRWGESLIYWDRLPDPESSLFPGDNPETNIDDLKSKISNGDYGCYIISAHSGPSNILIEPYCRNPPTEQTQEISKYLAEMAWYKYTGEDFYDPHVKNTNYDGVGTSLCGPNGDVELWIDSNGFTQLPPGGLPWDDDINDFYLAIMDDDEDGFVDEDPVNGTDDDGDGLVDEDPPGDANGDNAPGIRGSPQNQTGDGESDLPAYTTYRLEELVVLRNKISTSAPLFK